MNKKLEGVPLLSGRTERSHDHDHEMILVEPRGRPNDRLDDPKYHPYFDDSIETNVTFQVSKTAYLHCSIRQLGDRVLDFYAYRHYNAKTKRGPHRDQGPSPGPFDLCLEVSLNDYTCL
ncbi:uncharacterized protein TNCV_3209591 [Trichonephila clavipes]|nr:uncharacterized protein TNCV_3209591 [Trichonephila clavipes]